MSRGVSTKRIVVQKSFYPLSGHIENEQIICDCELNDEGFIRFVHDMKLQNINHFKIMPGNFRLRDQDIFLCFGRGGQTKQVLTRDNLPPSHPAAGA